MKNSYVFSLRTEGVDIGPLLPIKWVEFGSIGGLISVILPWVMIIAAVSVFLFLLWGGIQYVFSRGDPKQAEAARKRITYAIIGLVVLILAFLILQAVQSWTGIPIIED